MLQVQLRVEGRHCLVVGGGNVGTRRAKALLDADAHVVVVDPTPSPILEELALTNTRLELTRRPFRDADVATSSLAIVVAATDDVDVNGQVGAVAKNAGVLVNRSDDVAAGDLAFPALVTRGPVSIGVATAVSGAEPVPALAGWVAQRIEGGLEDALGLNQTSLTALAEILTQVRAELRKRAETPDGSGTLTQRTGFDWHSAFDESILELLQAGKLVEAKERIFACL